MGLKNRQSTSSDRFEFVPACPFLDFKIPVEYTLSVENKSRIDFWLN